MSCHALWMLGVTLAAGSPCGAVCIIDDTETRVCLDSPPSRLVSLYGAFTETLWEIGAGDALVARTKNDTTIPSVVALPSVGTGLRPNVEFLMALRPDLVVSRSSRAAGDTLSALRARGLLVAAFDPRNLADLYSTVERLGALTGQPARAASLVSTVQTEVEEVRGRTARVPRRLRVVYEVRASPLTVAGSDGLVNDLISAAGGTNAVSKPKKILLFDLEALLRLDPDVYVVQEGPMNRNPPPPGNRPHFAPLRAVRAGRVLWVDEQLFSRPGPGVAEAAKQLSRFLYPELWTSDSDP